MTTNIEWTDETWNPVTGCTKVSTGCKHCYAERMWQRLSAPNMPYHGRAFTDVQCHPERLEQPLHWKKPRRIFVNSMSDLFHESVPFNFIDEVFAIMALADKHQFQILTKRHERMLKYFGPSNELHGITRDALVEGLAQSTYHKRTGDDPSMWLAVHWPLPNVWLGVSVENQETANERIPLLLQTPAVVRFVSAEPLLGPIDLALFGTLPESICSGYGMVYDQLHWVIAGGESGPGARPMHPNWARNIRDQCKDAGVPFFMKQMGGKTKRSMQPIPDDLMIMEFPNEN